MVMKPKSRHRAVPFDAPWGRSLIFMTLLGVIVLLGTSLLLLVILPATSGDSPGRWFGLIPALVLLGALPFGIRGYRVWPDRLEVVRYGWVTRISLNDFRTATADPDAMRNSIRTLGNGGLFAFAGRFRNKRLGPYRAFATSPANAVVICFTKRKIVVTPEHPRRFLKALPVAGQSERGAK